MYSQFMMHGQKNIKFWDWLCKHFEVLYWHLDWALAWVANSFQHTGF